jgi:hypothetical protein
VHVVPIDELDIVLNARVSDGIDASGTLTATTGYFNTNMAGFSAPFTTTLPDTQLHAGQPWQFGFGIRYSDRLENRYRNPERAAQVTDFVVTPPAGALVGICEDPAGCSTPSISAPLPAKIPIPHGWTDQVSIRAGADWNIIPGQLAARVGASFDSSGFNLRYSTQDFMPSGRFGLHAGMTFRIERFDISFSYAHIFQSTETITDGNYRLTAATGSQGQCTEAGGDAYDPNNPVVSRDCYPQGFGAIVNNGTYTADFNIVSLDVRYHFE